MNIPQAGRHQQILSIPFFIAKSDGVRPIPSSFFQVVLGAKVVSLSHPRHRLD